MKTLRQVLVLLLVATVALLVVYLQWPRPVAARVSNDLSLAIDGGERRYRLVIPHLLPSKPVPVVFAFHGIGDSPESMANYSQLDRLAAKEGFILVYPSAIRSMWATTVIDSAGMDENADVRFFDHLLEHLLEEHPIDRSRIYVVGMSNGATFAQIVASVRPQVAAVVAHSGPPPGKQGPVWRTCPILFVVGGEDSAADIIRSASAVRKEHGHSSECIVVPGLGHEWSRSHNAKIWEFLEVHSLKDHINEKPDAKRD